MKRIGVFLFAGMMLAGMAGCKGGGDTATEPVVVTETVAEMESALSGVVSGTGVATATSYPTGNPSPTIVVQTGSVRQFTSSDLPSTWLTTAAAKTELVIDVNSSWQTINQATYRNILYRQRNIVKVRIMQATTARVVATKQFKGSDPGSFPSTHMFFGSSNDELRGEMVSDATIIGWLTPYVQR